MNKNRKRKQQSNKPPPPDSEPRVPQPDSSKQLWPAACPYLGFTSGCLAVAITILHWIGWRIDGHVSDVWPCTLAAILSFGFVLICGRPSATPYRWLAPACVGVTTAVGIFFACRIAPTMLANGSERPVSASLSHFASPVLAGVAVWLAQSWSAWRLHNAHGNLKAPSERAVQLRRVATEIKQLRYVLAWVIAVAVIYIVGGSGDRTGFRMITVPHDEASNVTSVIGYSALIDQKPIMSETVSAVEQVSWFAGMFRYDNSFRYLRAGYSFLGSQLSAYMSQLNSLLAINFLSWLTCLYLVYRWTRSWFPHAENARFATSAAVCLAAVGIGFAVHINDTTPHMLSFALYFTGLTALDELGIGRRQRNWHTHLLLAILFGTISLAYNVAQMLLLVYLVLGLRHQRIHHWVPVCLVTLTFRPIWQGILPALGINVVDVESEYLSRAIDAWKTAWDGGVTVLIKQTTALTAEIATSIESPWLIAISLVGLVTVRQRDRLVLCVMAIAAPVAACLVFAPIATARGYIIFGASIVLYVLAGGAFAAFDRRVSGHQNRIGYSAVCVLVAVCILQLFWSTSHYRGWTAPCKAFFLGWDNATALIGEKPIALNITGNEPVPAALNGDASFADAGVIDQHSQQPIAQRSLLQSGCARLPFIASILLILNLVFQSRSKRRIASSIWLVWSVVNILFAFATVTTESVVVDPLRAVEVSPGESLTIELDVAKSVREQMAQVIQANQIQDIELFVGAVGSIELSWSADEHRFMTKQISGNVWSTSDNATIIAETETAYWTFEIRNPTDTPVFIHGWQRTGLKGRRTDQEDAGFLPGIELRLREPTSGALRLALY